MASNEHSQRGTQSGEYPTHLSLPCPPHLLQVPKEEIIVLIQKPWEGRTDEWLGCTPFAPQETQHRILTSHVVGHLSSIVKKAELPSA